MGEAKLQNERSQNPCFQCTSYLEGHAGLYYSAYFGMTGLHALHTLQGRFTAEWNTPVDDWHFVDIVWIYLFPLLYLIDRHK